MAGQAKPNVKSVQDFAWLTKQEIQTHVRPEYWDGIKDILSEY
jgi:large subunit ribosomal protein L46